MYALVAPLVRLPRSLMPGAFDYHVPEALAGSVAAGSLVRVPWRSKPTTGVVLEVRATPDIPPAKAKDILGLAHPAPLPADCLAALRMVADEGVVPLANAADALVPEAPKRESKTAPDDASAAREDRPAANVAVSQARYANFAEKASRLVDALGPHLAAGQGCLVLAPHLDDLAPLAAELGQAFADVPLARLDSTLAKVPLWRGWTSGLAPGARIVLGTRGACLAPLANPGVIVVLEAPSRDHRSFDQQPKFDAREVARVRAEVARVPLVVMGAAGRAEDDAHDDVATEHSPTIVDTSGTRGQEGTLFPEPLRDAVEEAVAAGKRAAIVHNRRGSFRVLACVACSAPAGCPQCKSLATVHAGALRCHRCGWQSAQMPACAACGNHKLEPRGWGAHELAAAVRLAFPEAVVAVVDTDSKALPEKWDVAVGTVALTHALQELPDASALGVVAVNADSLLGGTDFRGTERAWQAVAALGRLARAHDAPLLVLTRKPDAPTTQRLLQNESVFLAAERADRASANYPPMARLVTVTSAGATPAAAMTAAKAAKAALTAALPANPALRPTLFGPYPAGTPLRHGSWRAAFAIKTPALTPELRASLAKIPETCSIDTNPESPE